MQKKNEKKLKTVLLHSELQHVICSADFCAAYLFLPYRLSTFSRFTEDELISAPAAACGVIIIY